jgi:hypothetical protein
MTTADDAGARFLSWLAALDQRHLADLSPSEVARALRALSSCYVERRTKLVTGAALGTAGKRAAFALFYAPLHFLTVREVVRGLGAEVTSVVDLGCGTGAAGASWALHSGGVPVSGFDRHPWAVAEAAWTYRTLGLTGSARQADVTRLQFRPRRGAGVLAAYTVNELPAAGRATLLAWLFDAASQNGARLLVVEPIARTVAPWWNEWATAFAERGGQAREWRFPASLPERQRQLARAAGLDPKELTARSLWL